MLILDYVMLTLQFPSVCRNIDLTSTWTSDDPQHFIVYYRDSKQCRSHEIFVDMCRLFCLQLCL